LAQLAWLLKAINQINRAVGNTFAWLSVAIVVVCFWVVIERYVFASTRLWMQDLYVWLNGAMFMAVAGFALLREEHVRVDIFYRPASPRKKAWADLFGALVFLLPFVTVVFLFSLEFVRRSWRYAENSANIGGMPNLYILKTFILAFAVLVGLQGVAMLIRSLLVLAGREDLVPEDYRFSETIG
jgi:TRAP-type mannitol/chloroaromatic compound transport system permease small subunit